MPIQVTCSSCSSRLKAPDGAAGRKLKCPKCGAPIAVAENTAVRKVQEAEHGGVVQEHDPFVGIGENQPEEDGTSCRTTRKRGSPVVLLVTLGAVLVVVPAVAGLVWWSTTREPRQLVERPTDTKTSEAVTKTGPSSETRPVEKKPGGKGAEKGVGQGPSEDEARAKLKLALDAWVFGDAFKEFEKKHPDTSVFDLDWVTGVVLLRYEITASRKTVLGYEFAVILTFQSRARTELKQPKAYKVGKIGEEKWSIQGFSPGS